ncbi:MAG: GGDEF domain-containing protein [Anaerovorax sp.]|nr:GGDEF domain-containing protein [Anaerovorax sp.]
MEHNNRWSHTLEKRRMQISNLFWGIVLIEFITEVSIFIILKNNHFFHVRMTESKYLWHYALLPSLINILFVSFSSICQRSQSMNTGQKNNSILITGSAMCFIIAYFHDAVFIVYASFTIPIMVASLFGEVKKTKIVFLSNVILSTLCWIHSFFLTTESLEIFFINLIAFYAILFASYLICQVLISYNKENLIYLRSGYRLQETLREQVKQDSLTGLYNQNTFFSYVNTVLKEDLSKGKITALAILDLDDFKKINDTYGHSTGNEVLTRLSKMLRIYFSEENEFVSRYGGEEFSILFRNTTQEIAAEKIDGFRAEFTKLSFSSMNNKSVTFSVGIAQSKFFIDTPDDLFDRADHALYQAKAQGKDRSVIFS